MEPTVPSHREWACHVTEQLVGKGLLNFDDKGKSDPLGAVWRAYVEAFRRGDLGRAEAAAREIYDELSPRLYGFLQSCGLGEADAEECLQEVFNRMFRSLEWFEGRGSLSSYAFRIARNEARRAGGLLSRIRRLFFPFSDDPEEAEDAIENLTEPIIGPSDEEEERRVALEIALEWLKSKYKRSFDVFVLMNHEGMKARQVAERLGIKASMVSTINARAKERLKKRFLEELSRLRRQRKDGNESG